MRMFKLRIVIITDWYSENMGYSENMLPKALAALGHEVHLITTNAQVYFDSPTYTETYEPFIGPGIVDCGVKEIDGYVLHRLPLKKWKWHRLIYIKGLRSKLNELRPHVVQIIDSSCLSAFQVAMMSKSLGFKLFGESHVHASVFFSGDQKMPLVDNIKWLFLGNTVGHFISAHFEKCYPISDDAEDIAVRYFGISKQKMKVCSLGVDTAIFTPLDNGTSYQTRETLRRDLGFHPSEIVCVYTGRLTEDKNPLCLAKAINFLAEKGFHFRGLFVGNGTTSHIDAIKQCRGCVVHPFVPAAELPKFYWCSDIGVWPRQESTSQLDAAACGLPLVLSNRIEVRERIEGNGILYDEDNHCDLADKLITLEDIQVRKILGVAGAAKVLNNYSWQKIARDRIADYESALLENVLST